VYLGSGSGEMKDGTSSSVLGALGRGVGFLAGVMSGCRRGVGDVVTGLGVGLVTGTSLGVDVLASCVDGIVLAGGA